MHPHTLTHPSLSKSLPKAASRKTAPLALVAPAGVCGSGKPAAARSGANGRRWAGPVTRRGRATNVPCAAVPRAAVPRAAVLTDVFADVISGVPTA